MNDGAELRDLGVERVDRNTPEWWKAAADRSIARFASLGTDFTAEDVRAVVGDPPNHPNAMGARFLHALRAKTIVKVGYRSPARSSSHASVIAVWRGT